MQHAFQIFNSCILLKKSIWIPDIPSTFVRDSTLVDAFFPSRIWFQIVSFGPWVRIAVAVSTCDVLFKVHNWTAADHRFNRRTFIITRHRNGRNIPSILTAVSSLYMSGIRILPQS